MNPLPFGGGGIQGGLMDIIIYCLIAGISCFFGFIFGVLFTCLMAIGKEHD